jgi:putative ABC transport system permease protein
MTPLSAFLLIVGLTRLLTRGTTKIYDKASKAVRFMTKDLWHVVNRNVVRNPRRTSSICLIIAIGLAFGIIVSSFMETQEKYAERVVVGNVGGDLSVVVSSDTNLSFEANLSAVEGVELLTPVLMFFSSNFEFITAINSSTYYDVVSPEQYFFLEGDAKQAIDALDTEGNAIINSKLAEGEYLAVGDDYGTDILYSWDFTNPESHIFTVVGIARTLPGLGEGTMPYTMFPQIYIDLDTLNRSALSNASLTMKFLIKVGDGYDPSSVANEISDAYPSNVMYISVLQEERERFQEDPIIGSLYNFLMPVFFFVVLIITIGLGLVMYIAAVERENEFAGFIARGASTKQVGSLLFGEGLTITLVGVLIGIITGLIAAFMINELISFMTSGGGPDTFAFLSSEVVIERSFVISWFTLALILVTIMALVIAGFIATLRIKRIKAAKALRERGG